MLKKDDQIEITIEDMGSEGEGIGHFDGITLFVKDAIKGDKVLVKIMKMKKSYGYARMMSIITPSPYRVEPGCVVARSCGGCQLLHASYEFQLSYKEDKVVNCLKRIGGIENARELMESIIGMEEPFHYRNKAQFPVGRDKEGKVVMGFYAGHSHNIIDIKDCLIQDKFNMPLVNAVKKLVDECDGKLEPYNEKTGKGVLRHVITRVGAATGEVMVCFVINKDDLDVATRKKIINALVNECDLSSFGRKIAGICLNINKKNTNVIMGDKIINIYGKERITDYIGDIKYEISPMSFFQVNPGQTKKLYDTALEFADITGNENVWDLYCGIGTISLFLAKKAKNVVGVEIISQAIDDAIKNAKLNGISNTQFYAGSAQEVVPAMYEQSNGELKADVVVVDPPRKGCDATLLSTLVDMEPARIVYVSCDPATLARDVKFLVANGYEMKRVRCVDMFGMGSHVETVCLLSKLHEVKHHVNVRLDMDELDLTSAERR